MQKSMENAVDSLLEVDHLTVQHRRPGSRERFLAVDGVSMRIGAAEVVGLVGESGSGKTSVAMAVTALGVHTSGTVRLLGRDLSRIGTRTLRALRPDVQVIFQDPHGSLDPRQRIDAGLRELRRLQPERAAWATNVELLEMVRLDTNVLQRYPHQLSGGQAQRMCIARALLMRPKLLVADEPTSGLDVSVQAEILRLLLELRDSTSVAILFISHDLGVVRRICDRVYVMLRGRIVEQGSTREVFEHPSHEYTQCLIASAPGRGREVAV